MAVLLAAAPCAASRVRVARHEVGFLVGLRWLTLQLARPPRGPLRYPAHLLCLRIGCGPCEGKKLWEADLAWLFLNLPGRKEIGDELIVVGFFVHDTEARARHPDDDVASRDLDRDFRSLEPRQPHCMAPQIKTLR